MLPFLSTLLGALFRTMATGDPDLLDAWRARSGDTLTLLGPGGSIGLRVLPSGAWMVVPASDNASLTLDFTPSAWAQSAKGWAHDLFSNTSSHAANLWRGDGTLMMLVVETLRALPQWLPAAMGSGTRWGAVVADTLWARLFRQRAKGTEKAQRVFTEALTTYRRWVLDDSGLPTLDELEDVIARVDALKEKVETLGCEKNHTTPPFSQGADALPRPDGWTF